MNKKGPVIIIEDDPDDQTMMREVFLQLNYDKEIIFFDDGHSAFQYLHSFRRKPFLILCDINMPLMNGFELRDKIHEDDELRVNCIPYLFLTTSMSPQVIVQAYSKSVQGFFVKPTSYEEMFDLIKSIMEYWLRSESPFYYL
ncbi:MAG: response regulator [Ferruginibacter sp.]